MPCKSKIQKENTSGRYFSIKIKILFYLEFYLKKFNQSLNLKISSILSNFSVILDFFQYLKKLLSVKIWIKMSKNFWYKKISWDIKINSFLWIWSKKIPLKFLSWWEQNYLPTSLTSLNKNYPTNCKFFLFINIFNGVKTNSLMKKSVYITSIIFSCFQNNLFLWMGKQKNNK